MLAVKVGIAILVVGVLLYVGWRKYQRYLNSDASGNDFM